MALYGPGAGIQGRYGGRTRPRKGTTGRAGGGKRPAEEELAEADRLNRRLATRLLVDGVGDKDARTSTGKASGAQG